jgi:hypothetical protein
MFLAWLCSGFVGKMFLVWLCSGFVGKTFVKNTDRNMVLF